MALTLDISAGSALTLGEYVELLGAAGDFTDEERVLATAEALRCLANDRTVLSSRVNSELADWVRFQERNRYSAQSLLLAEGPGFAVRANMWVPGVGPAPGQGLTPVHELPHDHNFSFLTVGYLGAGYRTRIWEYDPDAVEAVPGARVDLSFIEETTLPHGKVMFYRASRDVHQQDRPESFSVSLNLLVRSPSQRRRSQYVFDVESSTVKGFVSDVESSRVALCHLARYVGDSRTVGLLDHLSTAHPAGRVRRSAYESLLALEPSATVLLERAADDPDARVRQFARTGLADGFAPDQP